MSPNLSLPGIIRRIFINKKRMHVSCMRRLHVSSVMFATNKRFTAAHTCACMTNLSLSLCVYVRVRACVCV